ncbi:T9SS type B sorting domain-containing protein [Spirosoma rhododendri]|uniref:Gliding motility-associated C-terminal domain-containing protein n=1 Tax=Spirosoma rhododendri TaxID=2728024 RepID=A0A7L5DLE6_9BACT|nr:gliding motility-associated C-terminal domain-containing protein [Spirosoma rhododendri]QJD78915.1 gliding motility-associated C-terminal domain-containing protein [Spirosoma rhododendri]
MRLLYRYGLTALFFGLLLLPYVSQATHVRAGEITTRRLSATSLSYEVTLTAYYDERTGAAAARDANSYTFCFGDNTTESVNRQLPIRFINGRTSSINIYRTTHTFPGPGVYTISVQIANRNAGTINLPPPATSDNLTFFVSTTILIPTNLGLNSTPVMLNPPLDSARVGQRFCHNPAAYDADGDSLAYRLSKPQEGLPNSCRSRVIPAYQDPTVYSTTSETGGAPSFTIDSRTGQLCWDSPNRIGQFNFAFIVEEWRNGVLIGEVTRDMQIVVVDQPNKRPLIAGASLCVEAGTLIQQPITATDPDGQRVIINAYGGPLNVLADGSPLPASLSVPQEYARLINGGTPLAQPGTATFYWQTNCNQVRNQPYDITLKASDVPPRGTTTLVSFATLSVKIIAPAVRNLTGRASAVAGGRAIQINWAAYSCGRIVDVGLGPDTTKLIIYRREGSCSNIPSVSCTTGVPAGLGFTEVGRVPYTATTFTDTTALRRGVVYSYIIVARNPGDVNNGGLSLPSQQVCLELPRLTPVLTQVTVDSTNETRGRITLRWARPLDLRAGDLGAPYQYRIQRATGLSGTAFTTIGTVSTNLDRNVVDTVYVDQGTSTSALNTTANAYRYQIEFFYTDPTTRQLTSLGVADAASSVRLSTAPANRSVVLSWQTNTPWSNDNQTHIVYRSRSGPNGPFNRIADVSVQGSGTYTFTDTGNDTYVADGNTSRQLTADSSYCYRVTTQGRYTDTRLAVFGILKNDSQVSCAMPTDTTRPCPVNLGLDSLNCASLSPESQCNLSSFTNKLRWRQTSGVNCDPNVASYKIYYGRYSQDTPALLTSVNAPTTTFDHSSLTTVAGCYYVTAVNARGQESVPSNRVCNDACPYFALPNVFTPNGDGKNDTFQPMRCARAVESVTFVVFNRYGTKVYETTTAVLNWDGRASDGTELPSGLYYYQATVRYAVLDRNTPAQVFKGYVQILREGVSMR